MYYILIDKTDGSFPLHINQVSGKAASALLDSGTTDTYLLKGDGAIFETLFYQMTGLKYEAGETYHMSAYELMELPTLRFRLNSNLALEMGPSKYMEAQVSQSASQPFCITA